MPSSETCPKCSTRFPTRQAQVSRGTRAGFNGFARKGPDIRRTHCWYVSESSDLPFFGVIPPQALRWVIPGLLANCVVLAFLQRHHG